MSDLSRELREAGIDQCEAEREQVRQGYHGRSHVGQAEAVALADYIRELKTQADAAEGLAEDNANLRDSLRAENEAANILGTTCRVCGHLWRKHDPEDGKCDSHAAEGLGVCPCGRSIEFHQRKHAELSRVHVRAQEAE